MDRKHLNELERMVPGSVRLDEANRAITLIGWHLEQFENPESNENRSQDIKANPDRRRIPGMTKNFPVRAIKVIEKQSHLIGVVYPLSKTPKKDPSGDPCGGCSGVCGKKAGTIQDEDKSSNNKEGLVPVVNSKFRQRIFHFLLWFRTRFNRGY